MARRRRPGGEQGGERRKPRPFTPERAWEYLLFLLSRRAYTVAELRERLARRGLDEAEGERLLARLEELELVNDEAYAERYVSSRRASRGPLALRRELRRKGVAEELVDRELAPLGLEEQVEAAAQLLERNAWRYAPAREERPDEEDAVVLSDEEERARFDRRMKERAKAFAFLARRGFHADAASAAIERVGWFSDEE